MLRPACPRVGVRCFNPAQGRPPIPPLGADGRASYTAMAWTPAGEFEGHVHLIRADLYAGQPCRSRMAGSYVFSPVIGYYECLRHLAADRDEEIDGGGPGDRRRDRHRGECGLRRCPHGSSGRGRRCRRGTPARRPTDPDRRRPAPRRELPPAGVRHSEPPRYPHRLPSRSLRRRGARRKGGRRDAGCASCRPQS